ncbi:hypothetical protein FH972_025955 [Carpinus fangiana]|uniref:UPF0113 domain-containing protein n=1 Tax=Carpinus fangiana TaxID=176857 RepID=A0A5N6L2I3_9ROSI|nr:hypothetical protein FH972_025955 [Carpinus fangiana]
MPFLYGGNIVKAHVGRWSEDCPQHQGVVVLSMNDTPLVRAIGLSHTSITNSLADIGEYLREEDTLFTTT